MPGLPPLQPPSIPITFDQEKGNPSQPFYQYLLRLDQIVRSFLFPDGTTPLVDNNPWTAYTPTITAGSGTFTTVSATGRYKQIGKTVFVNFTITLTNQGSGASWLVATLPVAGSAAGTHTGGGREQNVTGKGTLVVYNVSTALVVYYDGTYPGVNGGSYPCSLVYEAA